MGRKTGAAANRHNGVLAPGQPLAPATGPGHLYRSAGGRRSRRREPKRQIPFVGAFHWKSVLRCPLYPAAVVSRSVLGTLRGSQANRS